MKTYPSIKKRIPEAPAYLFDKYDGSNIRYEWSKKRGFYKFGSRNKLIDESDALGETIELFREKYEQPLSDIFKAQKYDNVVAFCEFLGESSFAGTHNWDEEHDVILFDVNVSRKGITLPKEFIKLYGHLDIPKVVYHGKVTSDIFISIKRGEFEGVTFEGVVGKAAMPRKKRRSQVQDNLCMFKIKSDAWLERLKNHCDNNQALFYRLA